MSTTARALRRKRDAAMNLVLTRAQRDVYTFFNENIDLDAGPDDEVMDDEILIEALLDLDLDQLVQEASKPPCFVGIGEKYPLIVVVLPSLFVYQGTTRAAALRIIRRNWRKIQVELAKRYSADTYKGLRKGSGSPTSDDYRRYFLRHGLTGEKLDDLFEAHAAIISRRTSIGQTQDGTLVLPGLGSVAEGDGTVMRSMTKHTRWSKVPVLESLLFDPDTAELLLDDNGERQYAEWRSPRFDPTAAAYRTGDGAGRTLGNKFVPIGISTGRTNEILIISARHCAGTAPADEAAVGVRQLTDLKVRYPGLTAVGWDKAPRGKHMDAWMKLGLSVYVKGYKKSKKKAKKARGTSSDGAETDDATHPATEDEESDEAELAERYRDPVDLGALPLLGGESGETVKIYAYEYGIVMQGIDKNKAIWVHLPTVDVQRQQDRPNGPFRMYAIVEIPDDAALPEEMAGKHVRVRLDNTNDGKNRAEFVRVHRPDTDEFCRISAQRNSAESFHRWIKRVLMDKRARSLGAPLVHVDVIGACLYRNYKTLIVCRRRQNHQQPTDWLAA